MRSEASSRSGLGVASPRTGRRGGPRVDDRRVLNGIMWVLRSGAPWRDLPERYGPYTTCYNRFNRWRKKGIRDRLMDAIVEAYDGNIQMIDSSSVRVHQHAAGSKRGARSLHGSFPRRTDDEDPHRGHRALRARDRATPLAWRSASP